MPFTPHLLYQGSRNSLHADRARLLAAAALRRSLRDALWHSGQRSVFPLASALSKSRPHSGHLNDPGKEAAKAASSAEANASGSAPDRAAGDPSGSAHGKETSSEPSLILMRMGKPALRFHADIPARRDDRSPPAPHILSAHPATAGRTLYQRPPLGEGSSLL